MSHHPLSSIRLKIAQLLLGVGLLGIVAELFTGLHWLLLGSVPVAIMGALLGMQRWTCAHCGYRQSTICAPQPRCSVCGKSDQEQRSPPPLSK